MKQELMRAPALSAPLQFKEVDNQKVLQQGFNVIYQDDLTNEVTQEIVYFDVPTVS